MNTASSRASSTLPELAAWCRFSHDLLTAGPSSAVPENVRAMKRHLARMHRRHLAQLREWLPESDLRSPEGTNQRAWTEIGAALQARDERVVRAACALLHRAVVAAYERTARQASGDTGVMQLIAQQKLENVLGFRQAIMAQALPSEMAPRASRVTELASTLAS